MLKKVRRALLIAAGTMVAAAVPALGGVAQADDGAVVYQALSHTITVPTLVMFGAEDPNFFVPVAGPTQKLDFGGDDVTLDIIPDAGHALMFSRTAPLFRDHLSTWLTAHGF